MKSRLMMFSALLLAGVATPALSASATPEEAQRLTEVFQSYLGSEPGVVTVTPSGEAYEVKLDAGPLLAKVKDPKFSASLSPIVMTVSDAGDGKWKVDQDQGIELAFRSDGAADVTMKIAGLKGSGIFDEELGAFESSASDMTGIAFKELVTVAGEGTTNVDYTMDNAHYEQTMKSDNSGGANGKMTFTYGAIKETFNIPANPASGTPPMDFVLTAGASTGEGVLTGYRAKPLLDLLAFAVAHADKDLIIKDQQALKDKLRAAIPVFLNVVASGSTNDVKVQTMMGEFGIPKLGVEAELTGIVKEAKLREKISLEGLTTPPGIIPPWAEDMVPSRLALDFNVSGLDLELPAKIMLDKADFAKDPPLPPEMEAELTKLVLPNGTITVGMGPSLLVNKLAELSLEGTMSVDPNAGSGAMPTFSSLIGLKGFDALVAALGKVPPEMNAQQAVPALMMARGMAKNEADGSLSWKIESGPGGAVLINGTDVTKMGGQ